MSKNIKNKKIVFLFPSNAIKSNIVLQSILENNLFYKNYNLLMCFDCATGQNNLLAQNNNQNILIVRKSLEELKNIDYDYLISCGWGWKINTQAILKSKVASLNCHSSFLPDYKGGSVYNYYWANYEEYSGATIHFLSKEFDEGNILTQEKILISKNDQPLDILKKVSSLTAVLIREAIVRAENGELGFNQNGGRYFLKTNKYKLYLHRIINTFFNILNIEYRYLTKYKVIK